jgi:hypothetical protein
MYFPLPYQRIFHYLTNVFFGDDFRFSHFVIPAKAGRAGFPPSRE